jgi:hypothetical protein
MMDQEQAPSARIGHDLPVTPMTVYRFDGKGGVTEVPVDKAVTPPRGVLVRRPRAVRPRVGHGALYAHPKVALIDGCAGVPTAV